jgi:ketosteroid isomerase-like protein
MSRENVEILRRALEASSQGDVGTRADALVASFRGGKAVKLGYYNDQAQALEAVGLRE